MNLHPRFHQPMTPELLEELSAYRALYDAEVLRVIASWPVCGVLGRIKPVKVRRLRSVAR
jgi:hypothetical protein